MKKITVWFMLILSTGAFGVAPTLSKQKVVFRTDYGDLVFALYPTIAPKTVAQFLQLVKLGVYDSTHFYRVHPGFVLQVSDASGRQWPLTPSQKEAIRPLPAEFSSIPHRYGTLTMAHYDGQPDSGEVSFSIMLGDAPHLDGKYTVFGEMVAGHETLENLIAQPRVDTTPTERMAIRSALVAETPKMLKRILAEKLEQPRRVASQSPSIPPLILVAALVAIALIAGFVALLGRFLPGSALAGLYSVIVLICVFSLTVAFGPHVNSVPFLGAALCLSLLATFRLFSRFETH
jgi:cyclophilin family peptidyl-prolyl cis-trans isomerase